MRFHLLRFVVLLLVVWLLGSAAGCLSVQAEAPIAGVPVPAPLPAPRPVDPGSPSAPMEGLDYWLPFEDGGGDLVKDVTGQGHDGHIGGLGVGATWEGQVGLVPNDAVVTIDVASGRATFGLCAYYPAGGSPANIAGYDYGYLYGLVKDGENGYDLRTSKGPQDGIFHGADAYFPTIGRSNGSSVTQAAVGFSGNHCVEGMVGDTDHIVVDGVEVPYVTQGSTTDGVGGAQLTGPMYLKGGNGAQFGKPVTIYSAWGALAQDTVLQAVTRTNAEITRLQGLGVSFGPVASSSTDSTCAFDGTSIDVGFKSSGNRTSSLLQLNFPCTIEDFSESGQTPMEMVAGFDDRAGAVYHAMAARNIAYNGGVVNGVLGYLESPEDALKDVLAWGAKAHAKGYKTIATTMLSACPVGYNGEAGDTLAQAYNALLLAHGESFDWVSNGAAWPQLGATGACGGAYFADGLHPNVQGQAIAVLDERAAFEGVYGTALTRVSGPYSQLPSDRNVVTSGVSSFDVTLMEVNSASFNSAGRLCVNNVGPAMVRLVPQANETLDGQAVVEIVAGQTVCVRPMVVDVAVGGARWTVY